MEIKKKKKEKEKKFWKNKVKSLMTLSIEQKTGIIYLCIDKVQWFEN